MTDRPQFDADYIGAEFETIGTHLEVPTTVYCIGGGALALRGLKATTKDIDLVVADHEAHDRLWTALTEGGYEPIEPPSAAYQQLGGESSVENDDGCHVELFDRQVAGVLLLSEGMRDRSESFIEAGPLTVELVSEEDIFLFKAVTTRPTDVDDMNTLVQTGLDFETIEAELRRQVERLDDRQFVTYVAESLHALDNRYGVTVPIADAVEEMGARYYDALEVLVHLDESTAVETLAAALELDRGEVDARLDRLEARGAVVVEDGIVTPVDDGTARDS